MRFTECDRDNPCFQCDNTSCIFQGKKEAECPKYHCDRPDGEYYDCEHCDFINEFLKGRYGINI